MASRSQSAIPTILVGGVSIAYWEYVQYVLIGLAILVLVRIAIKVVRFFRSVVLHFSFRGIDSMDGSQFEHYIAGLLRKQGYCNVMFTEKYDYGVDIVAEKEGVRWGVQVKRYNQMVKADAVRQVVTGLRLYECDRGMVITNSTFSRVARELAIGNDCVLIDRDGLHRMIN